MTAIGLEVQLPAPAQPAQTDGPPPSGHGKQDSAVVVINEDGFTALEEEEDPDD
jgi:hypothetical protein